MVEATKERTERTAEQAFQRAEDAVGTLFENQRKTMQAVIDFNKNSMNTGYEFARNLHEEGMRLTDAWLENMTKFNKNYMKSFQDYTSRYQEYTEKVWREQQDRLEESLDQSMDIVTPGATKGKRR